MRRHLVLRKETLTTLAADDLAQVAAGAGDEIPTFKLVNCDSLLRPCVSHTCTR